MYEPWCVIDAFNNPLLLEAIHEDFRAIDHNNTWTLLTRAPDISIIGNKWLYKNLSSNGSDECLKACMVA